MRNRQIVHEYKVTIKFKLMEKSNMKKFKIAPYWKILLWLMLTVTSGSSLTELDYFMSCSAPCSPVYINKTITVLLTGYQPCI